MLKREDILKELTYWIAHLTVVARLRGKLHFFDLNVVSEDFFLEVMNLAYGLKLVNLNHNDLNSAAVDLGDARGGIAVQVTSERTKTKIQNSIDTFVKYGLHRKYSELRILIIGPRTGNYPTLNVPSSLSFDPKRDVIDDEQLLKHFGTLKTPHLESILQLMRSEITPLPSVLNVQQLNDLDTLEILRNHLDRPALKDSWDGEGSMENFKIALDDMISLINTGIVDEKLLSQPRFECSGPERDAMDNVFEQLRGLRVLFTSEVRRGNINITQNTCNFFGTPKAKAFDNYRYSMLEEFNQRVTSLGIKAIPVRYPS